MRPEAILDFWFSENARARWFNSTPEFDDDIRERFLAVWQQGQDGQLADWEQSAGATVPSRRVPGLIHQRPLNP